MSSSSSRSSKFSALSAGSVSVGIQDTGGRAVQSGLDTVTLNNTKRKSTVELKAQALGPLRAAVESSAESARFLDAARSAVEQVARENCEAAASVLADVTAAAENLAWMSGVNPPLCRQEAETDGPPSTAPRLLG